MGLLQELNDESVWRSFYDYKLTKQHLTKQDEQELLAFIDEKRYIRLAEKLAAGEMFFDYPTKKLVNKMNASKKRVVYSFGEEETWLLKLMAFLLYRYDSVMPDNLYSFRKNYGAKRAIRKLVETKNIDAMYYYKADISDYFNSIDIDRLLQMLRDIMSDDEELYWFFEELLTADKVYFESKLIAEKRGVMAGCPVAPFLANVYLLDLDRKFEKEKIPYARYSDDIICFADTKEAREEYRCDIIGFINDYGLNINPKKEFVGEPNETWEFLGIAYQSEQIDLSEATVQKMKGKIRRKARALYRWKTKKDIPAETAMKTFIRIFNHKFFDAKDANDLTWSRWFFPIINVDASLKEIDEYLQQYIRYIATGRHSKANYRVDYATLKACGYSSLVNEYYKKERQEEIKDGKTGIGNHGSRNGESIRRTETN